MVVPSTGEGALERYAATPSTDRIGTYGMKRSHKTSTAGKRFGVEDLHTTTMEVRGARLDPHTHPPTVELLGKITGNIYEVPRWRYNRIDGVLQMIIKSLEILMGIAFNS